MRLYCDLHIHSCLSPCGDELMTPNNIAGMAMLKGLDAIAVADHNSARNLPALAKTCAAMGVLLLPAMEITTAEEAHLLAYFPTVEAAVDFSGEIHAFLPPIPNRPDLFGPQQVLDENDEQVDTEEFLLLNALSLSLDELVERINARGGAAVPAHIKPRQQRPAQCAGFSAARAGNCRRGSMAGAALPAGRFLFARAPFQRRALSGKYAGAGSLLRCC